MCGDCTNRREREDEGVDWGYEGEGEAKEAGTEKGEKQRKGMLS